MQDIPPLLFVYSPQSSMFSAVLFRPGLGSIQKELELVNSIPGWERELELTDLEQNLLHWN